MLLTISDKQRRIRLVRRHRLSGDFRAGSVEAVANSLVALHATDAASVFLSIGSRLVNANQTVSMVESALYESQTLVRMHGMRHTLFVFPQKLVPYIQSSTTQFVAQKEIKLLNKQLIESTDFNSDWLAEVEQSLITSLKKRGQASARELIKDEPRLRTILLYGAGTRHQQQQSLATRLLRTLGTEGKIIRQRPIGSWLSNQFKWGIWAPVTAIIPEQARIIVLEKWLQQYGPGTEEDIKWWTGWTVTQVRQTLSYLPVEKVLLSQGEGFLLKDDAEIYPNLLPSVTFLPALDPTVMGWKGRDWFLEPDLKAYLFDHMGNAGPTIWYNGRVIGGWAQRLQGEIVWKLFINVNYEKQLAVQSEAERLQAWVGSVQITPRFRTPLERLLST